MKIYCGSCDGNVPLVSEALGSDDLNGKKIWGDIVCPVCSFVIATLEADEPGEYEMVLKVAT